MVKPHETVIEKYLTHCHNEFVNAIILSVPKKRSSYVPRSLKKKGIRPINIPTSNKK